LRSRILCASDIYRIDPPTAVEFMQIVSLMLFLFGLGKAIFSMVLLL
jgi:hypothetical protein